MVNVAYCNDELWHVASAHWVLVSTCTTRRRVVRLRLWNPVPNLRAPSLSLRYPLDGSQLREGVWRASQRHSRRKSCRQHIPLQMSPAPQAWRLQLRPQHRVVNQRTIRSMCSRAVPKHEAPSSAASDDQAKEDVRTAARASSSTLAMIKAVLGEIQEDHASPLKPCRALKQCFLACGVATGLGRMSSPRCLCVTARPCRLELGQSHEQSWREVPAH